MPSDLKETRQDSGFTSLEKVGLQTGFTLLEMIFGIAVVTILSMGFIGLSYIYFSYGNQIPGERLATEVMRQHERTLEEFTLGMRQAELILASSTLSGNAYTSASSTVVLRLLALDSSGNIIDNKYDYLAFYATSSNPKLIYKVLVADASSTRDTVTQLINNAVNAFTITYSTSTPALSTKMQVYLKTSKTSGTVTKFSSSTIEVTIR